MSSALLSTTDTLILGGYLILVLLFGVWNHFRQKSSQEFMDAGRNLPGWMVGFSLFGTYISSIALISFPGLTFEGNWVYCVEYLALPFATYIGYRFFSDHFRKRGYISAYSHFRETIGPWASVYAALTFVAYQTIRIGLIMYLVANSLSILMGWEQQQIMILTGLVVTAYTYLGGIRAVVLTDILQGILILLAITLLSAFILGNTPASLTEVYDFAASSGKLSLGESAWSLSDKSFLVLFLFGFTGALRWYGIDQACVQRYMIAKSNEASRSAVWMSWVLSSVSIFILFAIGTALFVFYQLNPEASASLSAQAIKSEGILPYFVSTEVPVGLVGLIIVAILAAAMSSIDTEMNSTATLVLCNLVRPFCSKSLTDRQSKRILTISSLAQGLLGVLIGLQFAYVDDVYNTFLQSLSILGGSLLGLFLLGFFFKRVRSGVAAACLLSSIGLVLWIKYGDCLLNPLLANFATTIWMLLLGAFLTAFLPRKTG